VSEWYRVRGERNGVGTVWERCGNGVGTVLEPLDDKNND
jgi:hypothetical protein